MDVSLIIFLVIEIIIFFIIITSCEYIYNFIISRREERLFNIYEYLPIEEVSTLKQVYYLSMMVLLGIDIIYIIISVDYFYLAVFDVLLSLFCCIRFDRNDIKSKIFLICLLPLPSMTFLLTENSLFMLLDLIHIIALAYCIKLYYNRFKEYTYSNGLGYTILLLFTIIFVSLFFTSFAENVSLLDAMVMVSNAFTSNGYTILGSTIPGKINSIVLVWGGYILSGVSTATLTAALILKRTDKKFKELENLIKEEKEKK